MFESVQRSISEVLNEVPDRNVPTHIAEILALQFNKLRIDIASCALNLRGNKADLGASMKVQKKMAHGKALGKTIPEKKMSADCDSEYLTVCTDYEKLSGQIQYLETMDNICSDYHTFFRRLST